MSDSAKQKELDDVELCYKAVGLSFSDPPDQVERVFKKLREEYNAAARSADPAARKAGADNLKQLEELYETITGSLIYKDYAREYEKYKQVKEAERQARLEKAKAKPVPMKICPYCGKSFMASLPSCSYCHKKYVSPFELMMQKYATGRNIAIAAVVALLVVAGLVIMLNPQMLQR